VTAENASKGQLNPRDLPDSATVRLRITLPNSFKGGYPCGESEHTLGELRALGETYTRYIEPLVFAALRAAWNAERGRRNG
jgi:hypothetical protein